LLKKMLGIHVAKVSKVLNSPNKTRKTMEKSIYTDTEVLGLNSAQIFVCGPRGYKNNIVGEEAKIKKLSKSIHLFVHSSYPSVGIWNVNESNKADGKPKQVLSHITHQLKTCKMIGADGLVVHLSRRPVEDFARTMTAIQTDIAKTKVPVYLEMIASKGHEILTYETPEKLNKLCKALKNVNKKTWGLCVDTAHLFGAGEDIGSKEQMDAWFDGLSTAAVKKIKLFHLNGSSCVRGSGKDKHSIPFSDEDNVYSEFSDNPEESGVASIIKFCHTNKVPIILEINRGSEEDTIKCLDIITSMGSW
jgi:deoxyribonuclease-4